VAEPADFGSVQYRPSGETLNSRGWTATSLIDLIGEPKAGCRLPAVDYRLRDRLRRLRYRCMNAMKRLTRHLPQRHFGHRQTGSLRCSAK
jgi:hypothetical protein